MGLYNDTLLKFFPGHAAEDDRAILDRVYVKGTSYQLAATPPPRQPRFLIGTKGSGKSAILYRLFDELRTKAPRVFLKPQLLPEHEQAPDSLGVDLYARRAREALVRAIAARVGATIPDKRTMQAVLRNAAVNQGFREKPAMVRTIELLASAVGFDVPADTIVPDAASADRLLRALREHLEHSGRKLYVLFDETDDYGNAGNDDDLLRLWGLLTAVRQLAGESDAFVFIVSLRTQVWSRLLWDRTGQRNQIGQFEPYCIRLAPKRSDVQAILMRRLQSAQEDVRGRTKRLDHEFAPFFASDSARVSWVSHGETQRWRELLVTQARCPRDSVALVNIMALRCRDRGLDRITQEDLDNCIVKHSRLVIDEMAREYAKECPSLKSLIHTLRSLPFHTASNQIRDHLASYIEASPVEFRGSQLTPGLEGELALWSLLFELGVIIARVEDQTQPEGYRHQFFDEDSDLVSIYRWDEMRRLDWEIHAVVRPALVKLKENLGE